MAFLALSHSRLLGMLYERVGPGVARPLADGPPVGTQIATVDALTLDGKAWCREFPISRESMLIFISPQCQACNELMPHVRDFLGRLDGRAEIHLCSVLGDLAMNAAYVEFAKLRSVPYLIADSFARKIEVAATPYGIKFDKNGGILAKGVVNHFEHLASLWNVTESARAAAAATAEFEVKKEDLVL